MKTCTCKECGQIFESYGNRTAYCSERCKRKALRKTYQPKISKRSKDMYRKSHDIYSVYDCKCAICGWQISEELIEYKGKHLFSFGNEIHHIVPVSEGGSSDLDNLVLLCPNCHKKADYGIYDRNYLKQHTKTQKDIEQNKNEKRLNDSAENKIASLFSRFGGVNESKRMLHE